MMCNTLLLVTSCFVNYIWITRSHSHDKLLESVEQYDKNKIGQSDIKTILQPSVLQLFNKPNLAYGKNGKIPTPVIQMHGMGDYASNTVISKLAIMLSDFLGGAYVLNVQIGVTSEDDVRNSYFMIFEDQIKYFAKVVKNDPKLSNGFNAIGYSQGNFIIRAYIELFNDPPVLNFISMHGPLAGVAALPECNVDRWDCRLKNEITGIFAYENRVQHHLAQANYYKDPLRIKQYLQAKTFLANINGEVDVGSKTQEDYKNNFESLRSLCLVKANNDTVVIPSESEWFGFLKDGSMHEILSLQETPWYLNNSFGLKTLFEENRVYFESTDGDHLVFDSSFLLGLVGKYFTK